MPYLAFLIASGLGATALVWDSWRHQHRRAALAVLGAATAPIIYWLIAVPRFPGSGQFLFGTTATLLVAILVPGGAGAAVAHSSRNRGALVRGLVLMLALWLPMAYVGIFSVCQLDPRCDL